MSLGSSSTTPRFYDFDAQDVIEIKLGGRKFIIAEQHEPAIVEVLAAFGADEDQIRQAEAIERGEIEAPVEQTIPLATRVQKQWDESYPVFATMLGYWEPGGEREDVISHLRKFLRVKPGMEIVRLWWEVNSIDDFLVCTGTFLIDPKIAMDIIREHRMGTTGEMIRRFEIGLSEQKEIEEQIKIEEPMS